MNQEMKYRVSDAKRKRHLRKCTDVADPEDLHAELGAARLLCQEALDQGQTGLAGALLTGIAKLSQSQVALRRMRNDYLERRVVYQLLDTICQIVVRAISGKFDNWEDAVEQMAEECKGAIASASNEVSNG